MLQISFTQTMHQNYYFPNQTSKNMLKHLIRYRQQILLYRILENKMAKSKTVFRTQVE